MGAIILLADAAHASPDGKVHALGLGWSTTVTPLPPQAVVVLIKVPWTRSNDVHKAVVELVSTDGEPMTIPGPSAPNPCVWKRSSRPVAARHRLQRRRVEEDGPAPGGYQPVTRCTSARTSAAVVRM
jgi:hypothetical protein